MKSIPHRVESALVLALVAVIAVLTPVVTVASDPPTEVTAVIVLAGVVVTALIVAASRAVSGTRAVIVVTTVILLTPVVAITTKVLTGHEADPLGCNLPQDLEDLVLGEECGDGPPSRTSDRSVH